MEYRIASAADLDLLAAWNHELIQDEGHRNPMSVSQLRVRMGDWIEGEYKAVIFEKGQEPVAYALYKESDSEVYLRQLFVRRDRRRQGIGREAVAILRSQLWSPNRRHTVEVLTANSPAVDFWRSLGYRDYSLMLEITPEGSRLGDAPDAILVVINGPIASGKNTVSTALAGLLEHRGRRAAVIDLDEVWSMLDHHTPRSQALEHWLKARRAAAVLTDEFYQSGLDVVIVNGPFFTETERRGYVNHLRIPVTPRFVTLRVSFEESWRRVQGDPRRVLSKRRDWLAERFQESGRLIQPLLATDLIVDTDGRHPDELAVEIAAAVTSGRKPTQP